MNFSSANLVAVEEKTGLLTYARLIAEILCTAHKQNLLFCFMVLTSGKEIYFLFCIFIKFTDSH